MEKKRLSKALAAAGVASRRACEELIFAGRVKVNGQVIKVPQTPVDWGADQISVDESPVQAEEQKVYYMLNKPAGYICTSTRPGQKRIVLDLFEGRPERLFTIGRLDKETEGLLLVTNDGRFAHEVIHPSSNIAKEYVVKTAQEITPEHLETLSQGARVDEKWVRPISVVKVRRGTFRIAVKEGRKHEVRIIAERAKLKVLELRRVRIGSLVLGTLPVGEYRPLTNREKELIFQSK
ncbi:MAG TPA: pseudouridine synthase [Chlamydiales bacterium]|jgi:23S rRNA pseudouridine2605 synthase|nr:pseudouridine synthase [Chlamydiales bacterium]